MLHEHHSFWIRAITLNGVGLCSRLNDYVLGKDSFKMLKTVVYDKIHFMQQCSLWLCGIFHMVFIKATLQLDVYRANCSAKKAEKTSWQLEPSE